MRQIFVVRIVSKVDDFVFDAVFSCLCCFLVGDGTRATRFLITRSSFSSLHNKIE